MLILARLQECMRILHVEDAVTYLDLVNLLPNLDFWFSRVFFFPQLTHLRLCPCLHHTLEHCGKEMRFV